MNIGFDILRVGMGNNGGTRTLIKCAETLNKLGHRAQLLSKIDNFNWFKHDRPLSHIPNDLDILIAASCHDAIGSTLKSKVKKKAWYIRAHETWLLPEKTLAELYNNPNIINIVNSNGLRNKLLEFGAESIVIPQGIDLHLWYNEYLRPKHTIRIGCLHTKQPRKNWKDFVRLHEILGEHNGLGNINYEYVGMGNSKPTDAPFLTEFRCNASVDELRSLYSSCDIWFAPTISEGLHNVPMEAALCGALVVCNDHPLNGMIFDYAFEDTAMIYRYGNIKEAAELIKYPDWAKNSKMQEVIRTKIGSRETNMKNLVEIFNG